MTLISRYIDRGVEIGGNSGQRDEKDQKEGADAKTEATTNKDAKDKEEVKKPAAEKAADDKLEADKLAKEKAEADKLASEKANADKAAKDKLAAEKAAADKLAKEIIAYLNGSELKIDKLDEYKNTPEISKDLKNSIDIALEFWKLVNENKNQMEEFKKLLKNRVKKDANLKESNLKSFLNKICASIADFENFIKMRGKMNLKTINKLTTAFDKAKNE
jgi:hypothetical protein